MKYVFYLILIIGLLNCQPNAAQTADEVISVEQFANQIYQDKVQLLDVRTNQEFREGHIEDAINIDVLQKDTFKTEVDKLDKDVPIYIYCRSGSRSKKAAKILKEKGFKKVVDLDGGYNSWKNKQ